MASQPDDLEHASTAKPFSGLANDAVRPIYASHSAPPTRRLTSSGKALRP
jgi:hypothetical protein